MVIFLTVLFGLGALVATVIAVIAGKNSPELRLLCYLAIGLSAFLGTISVLSWVDNNDRNDGLEERYGWLIDITTVDSTGHIEFTDKEGSHCVGNWAEVNGEYYIIWEAVECENK